MFLKDNAAMKEDLASLRTELQVEFRTEIKKLRDEMIAHVDGFIGLYRKHESELAAVSSRVHRLEEHTGLT